MPAIKPLLASAEIVSDAVPVPEAPATTFAVPRVVFPTAKDTVPDIVPLVVEVTVAVSVKELPRAIVVGFAETEVVVGAAPAVVPTFRVAEALAAL